MDATVLTEKLVLSPNFDWQILYHFDFFVAKVSKFSVDLRNKRTLCKF